MQKQPTELLKEAGELVDEVNQLSNGKLLSEVQGLSPSIAQLIELEFLKLIVIPCPGEYNILKYGFTRCMGKNCTTCNGKKRATFSHIFHIMAQEHLKNVNSLLGQS